MARVPLIFALMWCRAGLIYYPSQQKKNRGALLESIGIDLEICNCKLYHAPVFWEYYSHSSTIVRLFVADDSEDLLGLDMPKAICSVGYPEHSVELCSWGYGTCCCNTDLCQQIHGAHFVQFRKKMIHFGYHSHLQKLINTYSHKCRKTFNARRENITVNHWHFAGLS